LDPAGCSPVSATPEYKFHHPLLAEQNVAPSRVINTANLAKFSVMRWFKRKKSKTFQEPQRYPTHAAPEFGTPPASGASGRIVATLPVPILQHVFSFVCPHSQDDTYESCEQSALEDTCMLCDARDLSHCAQVSKKWRSAATALLYALAISHYFYGTEPELMFISAGTIVYALTLSITATSKVSSRRSANVDRN
jgi:hypothetical protein